MEQDGQLLAFWPANPAGRASQPASWHPVELSPSAVVDINSILTELTSPGRHQLAKQQTALVTASHRSDLGGLATPTACQSVNWRLAMPSQGPQFILAMGSRKSADLVLSAGWPWGMDSATCCLDIDTHTYIGDDSIEPFPQKSMASNTLAGGAGVSTTPCRIEKKQEVQVRRNASRRKGWKGGGKATQPSQDRRSDLSDHLMKINSLLVGQPSHYELPVPVITSRVGLHTDRKARSGCSVHTVRICRSGTRHRFGPRRCMKRTLLRSGFLPGTLPRS